VGAQLDDEQLIDVLQNYLRLLQEHPSAEEMMAETLTEDFATGFIGGFVWSGLEGLRDFLSQRDGFFDEEHTIDQLIERGEADNGDLEAHTRLKFFLRRWESPSPVSEEFTGTAFHAWRTRDVNGKWRVAAQMVTRFEDLNDNAERLFATPDEGLND
jgi:hypothetical protein